MAPSHKKKKRYRYRDAQETMLIEMHFNISLIHTFWKRILNDFATRLSYITTLGVATCLWLLQVPILIVNHFIIIFVLISALIGKSERKTIKKKYYNECIVCLLLLLHKTIYTHCTFMTTTMQFYCFPYVCVCVYDVYLLLY